MTEREAVWALALYEPIVSLGEYWHDDGWPRLWYSYVVLPEPWEFLHPAEERAFPLLHNGAAEIEQLAALLHRASIILEAVAAGKECRIAAGSIVNEIMALGRDHEQKARHPSPRDDFSPGNDPFSLSEEEK